MSDQLQPEDTLDDRGVDDILDEGISPPDREPKHLRDAPSRDGESLEDRLAQEEPDPDPYAEADLDPGPEDVGIDGAGVSAEEAAVHVINEDAVGPETEPDIGPL